MLSLPGAIGAVVGLVIGLINYGTVTATVVKVLRKLDRSQTAEERQAFERKVKLLQLITFVFAVTFFPAIGYWFGATIGSGALTAR